MFSNKFIQRFLKACQVVFLTGNDLKTERVEGNIFNNKKLSTKELLENDTEKFWQEVFQIRQKYRQLQPNLGHYALVDLENRFDDFTLITTSFDGLHQRAGNKNLIELKGNVLHNRCLDCGNVFKAKDEEIFPKCPYCGSVNILPDILMEGEAPEATKLRRAQRVAAEAEVFVSAGFNDENEDIKALPFIAKANGAYLLEINRKKTDFSKDMNDVFIGNPAKLLTAIVLILEKI